MTRPDVHQPSVEQQLALCAMDEIACGDPVAYFEHKELWADCDEVDPSLDCSPALLGKARQLTQGSDLTIVSWSKAASWCRQAAAQLRERRVNAEVIDLRSLWPWDRAMVLESAARSARVLVVHEAVQVAGFGAEIAAVVAEQTGARVARLGAMRAPVGYSPGLEAQLKISTDQIVSKVLSFLA